MDPKNIDLKQTLNLPRTTFPMEAKLRTAEPKMLDAWEQEDLYGQIRDHESTKATSAAAKIEIGRHVSSN